MATVIPQRDLRNHNAQIMERVRIGESFVVTKDGVPIADVVPHVPTDRPPMFRPATDPLCWEPITDEGAAAWLADIRRGDDLFDHAPRDPWEH